VGDRAGGLLVRGRPLVELPHEQAPSRAYRWGEDGLVGITDRTLKANKVSYEAYIYPGTQHGFNNDTTPRCDKAAAALAWQRTIEFFKKNLKS
jgi:carboxymethylenebutenolidase